MAIRLRIVNQTGVLASVAAVNPTANTRLETAASSFWSDQHVLPVEKNMVLGGPPMEMRGTITPATSGRSYGITIVLRYAGLADSEVTLRAGLEILEGFPDIEALQLEADPDTPWLHAEVREVMAADDLVVTTTITRSEEAAQSSVNRLVCAICGAPRPAG